MKPVFLLFIAALLSSTTVFSTHMRGGQIRVIQNNSASLTCVIELTVYTDTRSEIKFGEGLLDFGDGNTFTTPTIDNTKRPDISPDLGVVTFQTTHTYAAPGTYVITYQEPNLTGGILNMFNSVETRFYTETTIVLQAGRAYTSPEFPASPIFLCQSEHVYSFSGGAVDETSREVFYKYSLVSNPTPAKGFRLPENLTIDENNGIITWDTRLDGKFVQGMIWIVVKTDMFLKNGDHLGYVNRAMQIIVEDSDSQLDITNSNSDSNGRVVIKDGQEKVIKVVISDPTYPDNLHFALFASNTIKNNVTLTQYDSTAGKKFRVAKLKFITTPDIVSDLPYTITLRGISKYSTDISFLYLTNDAEFPPLIIVTGIESQSASKHELNAFPNPFQSEVYVDGVEAIFTNSTGQVVMRSALQDGKPVNTSALPAGFYILQVINADGTKQMTKMIRN